MEKSQVLVVEHNTSYREALVGCLRLVGLETQYCDSARSARVWLTTQRASIVVIASNLPDGTIEDVLGVAAPRDPGLAIVQLQHIGGAPSRQKPRVKAMFKHPVSLPRLVEQVEVVLGQLSPVASSTLEYGPLCFDTGSGLVRTSAASVGLGPTEAKLIRFFMSNPDRVFSRADLLRRVWPGSVRVEERTVDVHIGRLRQALAILGADEYIQTVRRTGYRFSLRTS